RDMIVKTKLAEPTFANLTYALNDGTTATGTGYQNYTPAFTDSATQPTYRALIVHGWAAAPGAGGQSFRRMVILRRVLSSDDVEISYMKDKQTLLTVSWSVHYVSATLAPFKIIDQTA
ncbi:MAG: hypothetical protein ABR585_13720, partial [Gemmatimonadaceae bacterium]